MGLYEYDATILRRAATDADRANLCLDAVASFFRWLRWRRWRILVRRSCAIPLSGSLRSPPGFHRCCELRTALRRKIQPLLGFLGTARFPRADCWLRRILSG
jgi:hypothetical protein